MNILKSFIGFYLNASIHVALAVCAMVKVTRYYLNISDDPYLDFFIFFGTITGYNFVKYAGVAKLHHRSLTRNLQKIQIFSLCSFIAMLYFADYVSFKTLFYVLPFSLLTLFYAIPFLSGFARNLRQVSYLKIIVVALVWAGFTVLIPSVNSNLPTTYITLLLFLQRFLIVVVLIFPFDIRDVKYDAISLQTIPKKIGVQQTKRMGLGIMIITLLIQYALPTPNAVNSIFMIFFFLVVIAVMRAKINQSKYYSSFWVESLPIIWWLLLLGYDNLR